MLLAVDIGNTNIHLGLFDLDSKRLASHFTVSTSNAHLENIPVDSSILQVTSECVLASVNPETENAFCNWLNSRWNKSPLRVPSDVSIHMPVLVKNPESVGVDRLLNALAAFRRTGTTTIVVDVGTAVTIDVISKKGEFLGGVIAPGLESLKEALHTRTALLPKVSVQRPQRIIGKDTEDAVKSGLYWGAVGVVEKITKKLIEELDDNPSVLATGGDAELIASEIQLVDEVVPHLTLEGILTAYNAQFSGKGT
ncbi:MAG: type III pantothenate kinase [Candidatus Brocadiales bacterium]